MMALNERFLQVQFPFTPKFNVKQSIRINNHWSVFRYFLFFLGFGPVLKHFVVKKRCKTLNNNNYFS